MKELIKIKIIILILVIISLTSCWTKKCEKPDEEHRSWTMVPEGRTEPMIFRNPSGKLDTFVVHPPTYGKDQPNGSTSACTGSHYGCQLNIDMRNGRERVYWSIDRDNSGNHTYSILNDSWKNASLRFNKDSLISTFPSNNNNVKFYMSQIIIIKNKGIQYLTINDTIHERIN